MSDKENPEIPFTLNDRLMIQRTWYAVVIMGVIVFGGNTVMWALHF